MQRRAPGTHPGAQVNIQKHIPLLAALAIVAVTFVQPRKTEAPDGPVAAIMESATRQERARLAGVYSALADVTSRDKGKVIQTTAMWRQAHSNALRLAFGDTGFVGKYRGLDQAVDGIVQQGLGNKVRSMTDDADGKPVWQRVADACLEVSAQCE